MSNLPNHIYSINGDVARPFQSSGWLVPSEVRYDNRYINWKANLSRVSPRQPDLVTEHPMFPEKTSSGGKGMLNEFLALEKAPAKQIANFVARWGPLGLRRVLLRKGYRKLWCGWNTIFHYPDTAKLARQYTERPPWSFVDEQRSAIQGRDPVYAWRYWSGKFIRALRVWDFLKNGKASLACEEFRMNFLGLSDDPKTIEGWEYSLSLTATKYDDIAVGLRLAYHLKDWMDIAGVSLEIKFSDPAFLFGKWNDLNRVMHFEIATNNAFGGLILQLAAAISGISGYAICSLCGGIYNPTRQPRAGVKHYCQICKKRAAVIKVQRHRARKRAQEEARLQSGGRRRKKTR